MNEENITDNNVKVPKKRGRKPKNATIDNNNTENSEPVVQVEKIPKKRGRKPKNKPVEEVEKIPKKRGRKPKEKVYSVKELPKTFYEENKNETLILHLPINIEDKNNDPEPLDNDTSNLNILDNNEKKEDYNLPTQVNFLENNSNDYNSQIPTNTSSNNETSDSFVSEKIDDNKQEKKTKY